MKAIILDGYFAGLIMNHDGNPVLRLPVPAVITICNCDPISDYESEACLPKIEEYKIAARGYDDSAIYTKSGDLFKPMTEGRDWVIDKRKSPYYNPKPVYFSCREEGAWQ